jgi:hypothetical protein
MDNKLKTPVDRPLAEIPIRAIQEAVERIQFGVVQLIIQDGRIVQIDMTEKIRLG